MPIGQIFQGVTTAPCRDFVAKCILKENPAIVYMPCAGRFGSAQAYINHGGVAEKLVTSDICLFSSMLGYLFDESKNVEELQIKNGSPIQPIGSSEIDIVSAAMLAIKYGQIATSSKYGMNLRKEILLNQEKYLESIKKKISVFTQQMSGCKYDIEDMWDVINAAKNDEKACIFVNVPTYKGGYEKMFANSGISWNEPNISQFNPALYEEIIKTLSDAKCKAFIYSQKNLDMIPDEWQTVYAQPYSIDRTDYVVSNKMGNNTYAVALPRKPHKIFPIYSDEDITEDTKIEFVQVDKETALYYRDLFVHKLGTTLATEYFLMLIDGKVNTTIGITMRDVFTLKSEYVGEVFGISRSSIKYKRLGKLFMMCLTSGDFKRFLEARYPLGIREIKGIKTSSLTTYWEGKTDRSVMKLTYREQLKDGTFRVIYQGDFRDDTYRDCVCKWLSKWGKVRR